ncbi:MAG TPA: hypothetical protein VM142_10865 [Acidimicrobiales bacterium]|nr:hypothetical protein [Acidimicrobiales bacterium]
MGERDDSFDDWVAEVGGPEAIVAMVDDLRRQVDEGLLPGFTNREDFLAHLGRPSRRSA